MPTARESQPIGFFGRLEAIRGPTIRKGRKGSIAHTGVLIPPVPQLPGGRTGRVTICRITASTNEATPRQASDQASQEATRVLLPPTLVVSVTTLPYSTTVSDALRSRTFSDCCQSSWIPLLWGEGISLFWSLPCGPLVVFASAR